MKKYTVIGGHGFIGSHFVSSLDNSTVWVPEKNDPGIFKNNLGILIYCAGNGDCNNTPFKVIDSNITYLSRILEHAHFDKIIYLSSTRLYMNSNISKESENLKIDINDERALFNLTKITAEELCKRSGRNILIIRPSNVYGLALESKLFLPSIIRNAINNKVVDMYVPPSYAKDYISVYDLVEATLKINNIEAIEPISTINIASGINVSAKEIADVLIEETGCKINWHNKNPNEHFPITNTELIHKMINFTPSHVLDDLKKMITNYKKALLK